MYTYAYAYVYLYIYMYIYMYEVKAALTSQVAGWAGGQRAGHPIPMEQINVSNTLISHRPHPILSRGDLPPPLPRTCILCTHI